MEQPQDALFTTQKFSIDMARSNTDSRSSMKQKPGTKPKRPRVIPLRSITLRTAPFHKHAIAWSCDAELAVAADDSVHVLVPHFAGTERAPLRGTKAPEVEDRKDRNGARSGKRAENGEESEESEDDSSLSDDGSSNSDSDAGVRGNQKEEDLDDPFAIGTEMRQQFAAGSRHIPVSYPPLDPRINRHLYAAAGLPFPFDALAGGGGEDYDSDGGAREDEPGIFTTTAGAGSGLLTSTAATMNSVVDIGWSPTGLGRNRRPVLAVLTASGALAVYGEGGGGATAAAARTTTATLAARRRQRQRRGYDPSCWEVLWGAGERLVVPPQAEFGECVISFAWAPGGDLGPGRALLFYRTDEDEVVVLTVESRFMRGDEEDEGEEEDAAPGPQNKRKGGAAAAFGGASIWRVQEAARFSAGGPHPPPDVNDPDYVPCGTSYGIRCSPYLAAGGDGRWVCMLAYVARNYVGFRKIGVTIADGGGLRVEVEEDDTDGICLFLSTDAFVEWENVIWSDENRKVCRGVIATPFVARTFEVPVSGSTQPPTMDEHAPSECGTTYPKPDECHTNPIQGLMIHQPDATRPTPTAIYTLVRMSATATNPDWFESNAPAPVPGTENSKDKDRAQQQPTPDGSPRQRQRPQWAVDVEQKTQIAMPAGMVATNSGSETGDEDDELDGDDDDALGEVDDNDIDNNNDNNTTKETLTLSAAATAEPDIHLHRIRLWGLAASPGGGSSAVLVTQQSAHTPERGGWYHMRSRVLFGYAPRPSSSSSSRTALLSGRASTSASTSTSPSSAASTTPTIAIAAKPPLTTEAKMWEFLYGGGPHVPGLTRRPPTSTPARTEETEEEMMIDPSLADDDVDDDAARGRREVLSYFREAVRTQRCRICDEDEKVPLRTETNEDGETATVCAVGHVFNTCGATGLAIQTPGTSRVCGVCGARTLTVSELVRLLPDRAESEAVRRHASAGLCGRCGGKFVD